MSKLPDPPLRDKDRASMVWDAWFREVGKMVAEIQPHIPDTSTPDHSVSSWAEVDAAIYALGDALALKINTILAALEAAKILEENGGGG